MSQDVKKIIKVSLVIILFIILAFLAYNNFIKNQEKFEYFPPSESDIEDGAGSDADIFSSEIFENLVKPKYLQEPTSAELGRPNPFLEF